MGARILWRDASGVEGAIDLVPGVEVFVGRAAECAIRTGDAMVSRRHARIWFEGERWVIEDLGAANGVMVKDARVQRHVMAHNDAVLCGSVWLRFLHPEQVGMLSKSTFAQQPAPPGSSPPPGGSVPMSPGFGSPQPMQPQPVGAGPPGSSGAVVGSPPRFDAREDFDNVRYSGMSPYRPGIRRTEDVSRDLRGGSRAQPEPTVVDWTVFSPTEVLPGDDFLVQVFAHLPERAAEAAALAREFDADAARRGKTSSQQAIAHGDVLTFELTIKGLDIEEPVEQLVWRGETCSVEFGVAVPAEAQLRKLVGKISVCRNSVPIGRIRFTLRISDRVREQAEPQPSGQTQRYRYAFISYASADRDEVLRRVQMLESLDIEFFQDVLSLDPGVRWERELYRHIDRADVVYLFWSPAARDSDWVLKEIRYALSRQANEDGPPDIVPILVGAPPPATPPSDLGHLHFGSRVSYFMRS